MVNEHAYHTWPLFNTFRENAGFMTAYEKIYGRPFVVELKRAADAALTEATNIEKINEEEAGTKSIEEIAVNVESAH